MVQLNRCHHFHFQAIAIGILGHIVVFHKQLSAFQSGGEIKTQPVFKVQNYQLGLEQVGTEYIG